MDSQILTETIKTDPLTPRIFEEHDLSPIFASFIEIELVENAKLEANNKNGKIHIVLGSQLISEPEPAFITHKIAHYFLDQIKRNNLDLFVLDKGLFRQAKQKAQELAQRNSLQKAIKVSTPLFSYALIEPRLASRCASRYAQKQLQRLTFNDQEQKILNIMRKAALQHKQPMYLVGGCIRDKLLGIPNTDLDFMTVTEDLTQFVDFITQTNNLREPVKLERSEAYTMRIGEVDVDLIDARRVYMPISKELETLEEEEDDWTIALDDIFRRDLTINAITYNVIKNKLEDATGRGFKDLQQGIIQTIIDPYVKYRINAFDMLRALRFAAIYDFTLGQDMLSAMKTNAHRVLPRDLGGDISNRRIARELRKAAKTEATWNRMKKLLEQTNLSISLKETIEKVEIQRTTPSTGKEL